MTDFNTTLKVSQTPHEAFAAITNLRGWWSAEIEGNTDLLNEEFKYQYEDVHASQLKLIELVPDQKVVWLVKSNYFKFTQDKTEWTGTKLSFEISAMDKETQIRFTHIGLVPEYECYSICSNAWTQYVQESLRDLITTGQGRPNAKGKPSTEDEKRWPAATEKRQDYTATLTADLSPPEAFKRINAVTQWWTADLTGNSQKLNDEFTVRFGDVHVSTQKIVELVPDKKVVWLVTESKLNFITDKQEWTGTKICFELSGHGDKTQIKFTHVGLVPEVECYNACSGAWDQYLQGSLFKLLTEGKGRPG